MLCERQTRHDETFVKVLILLLQSDYCVLNKYFAGEVTIDLAQSPLDEEAEWHILTTYKNGLPDHLVNIFINLIN